MKHRETCSETDPEIHILQMAASFRHKLDIVIEMQSDAAERTDLLVRSILPTRGHLLPAT
jgi:hypothetical protein